MSYCRNCGKELCDQAYVCPHCGVKCKNDLPKKNQPFAIASLVMGILALVSFYGAILCGILAIVFANLANKKIAADLDNFDGAGMAKAGKIMGIIGVAIWGVLIIIVIGVAGCMATATYL